MQPGAKRSIAAKRRQRPIRFEQRVLEHVLGLVAVPDNVEDERSQAGLVEVDELGEGGVVAAAGSAQDGRGDLVARPLRRAARRPSPLPLHAPSVWPRLMQVSADRA